MAASATSEIVMPRMGLTMEEGTVVSWLKAENSPVKAGEPLLEIETDKSTVEIEAPVSGVLSRILVHPGETALVGAVIGYLALETTSASGLSAALPSQPERSVSAAKVKASPAARSLARRLNVDLAQATPTGPEGRVVAWNVAALAEQVVLASQGSKAAKATPLAQKLAADLGVNVADAPASGPAGWVTRADVQRLEAERAAVPAPVAESPAAAIPPASAAVDALAAQVKPLSRSHKVMAERMAASFQTAPHFYLHVDVDCRKLTDLRAALLPKIEARSGVRVTFTDFLVKFAALTLPQHPRFMQQWSGDALLQYEKTDIGLAMDAPGGLVVPVIRNAAALSLAEIARHRLDLSAKAQAGKLLPGELELGVFTITNLGMFGIDAFDAILNPPQAAILAVGRIKDRALVADGQVLAAPMMTLSLSVDHRVLDGATAARFLGELAGLIEDPQQVFGY